MMNNEHSFTLVFVLCWLLFAVTGQEYESMVTEICAMGFERDKVSGH